MDSDVNTEILEQELMKKIVLIENNLKEILNKYFLKINQKLEKIEEDNKGNIKVIKRSFNPFKLL